MPECREGPGAGSDRSGCRLTRKPAERSAGFSCLCCIAWQSATLCGMAKNIRISDSLYRLAQLEAQLENRSLAQQVEYWAKLGMAALRATPDAGRADLNLASA